MDADIAQIRVDVATVQGEQDRSRERLQSLENAAKEVPVQAQILRQVQQDVTDLKTEMRSVDRKVTNLKAYLLGGAAVLTFLLPVVWQIVSAVVGWMKQ